MASATRAATDPGGMCYLVDRRVVVEREIPDAVGVDNLVALGLAGPRRTPLGRGRRAARE